MAITRQACIAVTTATPTQAGYPTLTLVSQGFDVQVVADAGGSPTVVADDISLRRMERAGATLTTTNQLIAELAGSWATPEGGELVQLIIGALQS